MQPSPDTCCSIVVHLVILQLEYVTAGVILLDLHGLHVSEALKILGREIGQLQEGQQGKGRVPVRVHVLVGTGHHTRVTFLWCLLTVAVVSLWCPLTAWGAPLWCL